MTCYLRIGGAELQQVAAICLRRLRIRFMGRRGWGWCRFGPGDTLVSGVKGGPMVYIASWWTPTSPLSVNVFSNCDTVSLYLNDSLIGTEGPTSQSNDSFPNLEHGFFTFKLAAFKAGTLSAKGITGGVVQASYQVSTPGKPKSISLTVDTAGLQLAADGSDIAIIYASILDSNNTVVPTATSAVTFSITGGSGTLIGNNPMAAQAGIATILLRAGTAPGVITVSASGSGLTGATATVAAAAPGSTAIFNQNPSKRASTSRESISIRRFGSALCVYAPEGLVGNHSPARFSIYNAEGRLIGRWDLAGGITAVKMTSLPHGIYIGQVTSAGGKIVQKVIW